MAASAGAATLAGGSRNESFQAWFVQFKTPPAAKGGSKAALAAERTAFFKNAADQGVSVTQRRSFDTLWNGVSVNVPKEQAGALGAIPGVQAVYPVVPVALPPSAGGGTSDPDLKYATGMTGASSANEAGFTGKGVKVAIMDSGLDYTLPEFGSCQSLGPNCRVAGGFDLVGDNYDSNSADSTYQPIPHPDSDPAPCDPNVADEIATHPGAGSSAAAHGTHVAGIVGADGRSDPDNLVTGVAPEATLYAYRVFGCNGSTDSDVMAEAMERAFADGAQVLNMSIGAALFNFPNYPTAQAADALADRGVVVVASIGNSGDTGLYSAGAPGVGEKVIGVASVDNIRSYLAYFTLSADDKHIGYTSAAAAPATPTSGQLTLAQTGTPTTANDACPTAPAIFKDLGPGYEGKAVLIRRGTCGFYNKALTAQHAGAAAVILYNNAAGRINPTVAPVAPGTETINIPVVAITAADGATMSGRITAGPTKLTWTDQSEYFDDSGPADTGGRTSSFSSWGTSSDLGFKPDITAPGGNIRSTWPHQQHGGHWVISGTSMASPHVAGAVALYLQAHPGTSPLDVRIALQNSADPVAFTSTSFADSTARQGAGLLDIPGAISAKSVITPSKVAFGQVLGSSANATITIRNNGTAAETYTLSSIGAVTPTPDRNDQLSVHVRARGRPGCDVPEWVERHGAAWQQRCGPDQRQHRRRTDGHAVRRVGVRAEQHRPSQRSVPRLLRQLPVTAGDHGRRLHPPDARAVRRDERFDHVRHRRRAHRWANPTGRRCGLRTAEARSDRRAVPLPPPVGELHPDPAECGGSSRHSRRADPDGRGASTSSRAIVARRRSSSSTGTARRSQDNGGGNGDQRKVVPNGIYKLRLSVQVKALGDPVQRTRRRFTSPPIHARAPLGARARSNRKAPRERGLSRFYEPVSGYLRRVVRRFAVLRFFVVLRFAVLRLVVLRFRAVLRPPLRPAAARFRVVVLRFAAPRLAAVERFRDVVFRFAVLRFFVVLRFAVLRLVVLRFRAVLRPPLRPAAARFRVVVLRFAAPRLAAVERLRDVVFRFAVPRLAVLRFLVVLRLRDAVDFLRDVVDFLRDVVFLRPLVDRLLVLRFRAVVVRLRVDRRRGRALAA